MRKIKILVEQVEWIVILEGSPIVLKCKASCRHKTGEAGLRAIAADIISDSDHHLKTEHHILSFKEVSIS